MMFSTIYSPNSLFLTDTTKESGRKKLAEHFPITSLWDRGFFHTNGLSASYYIAKAANQRAIAVGCSGLNTQTLLDEKEVERLNNAGITVIWMALPSVGPDKSMLDTYLNLARDFFTNKDSPANILLHSDDPRYAITYSAGGQIFFHLMQEPNTRRLLSATFSGAVHVTPYFDTAHASRDHSSKIVQWIFEEYMSLQRDMLPNKRLFSNAYMTFNNWVEKNVETVDVNSTCGQILELKARGQELTASENFNVAAASSIPSIFVIGDKDNFACPQTAMDVAKKIGADILVAEGAYHNPLRTHPHLLDVFIKKVDECIALREKDREETALASHQPVKVKISLGDRARLALQRGASFLYSPTSFF